MIRRTYTVKLNKYLGLIGAFLGVMPALFADIDIYDYGSEDIKKPAKEVPYSFELTADIIGDAKIKDGFFKGEKFKFSEVDAELGMVVYYCPAYVEGANVSLSYTATRFKWDSNPWFDQQSFNTISLNLGGFTERLSKWFWQGQIGVNLDTDGSTIRDYLTYDFILWGRRAYNKNIGFHIGLLAQTGMRMNYFYPILGADWQMSRNWKLNLVFPVNVSLEYTLNRHWSLALAGRNFNSRHRAGKREGFSKAVLRYQNVGAEFAVKYEKEGIVANVHAGTTLGGSLRVANRHNHHHERYKLKPSGYVGAESTVKF